MSETERKPLEDAAYDCMSELAGVDTHDVNLRDHPEAWAAIETFTANVRAAERSRIASLLRRKHEEVNGAHNYFLVAARMVEGGE